MRTITAACTEVPLADLTEQICATTSVATGLVSSQRHVLGLELIGFVLP
ncbi:hypothetical protein ACTMTJ_08975 [Phytohabitans sp. LJ34]